jgi:glycosyltransferase involved in cell wall biosynthesis
LNGARPIDVAAHGAVPARAARWWFVTRKRLPAIGGMERLWHELTSRVARRRDIEIVAIAPRQPLAAFLVQAAVRLAHACRRGEVALVHLGDPVLAPLALIPRRFGIPVVVTIHGLDVVYASPIYRAWRWTFLRNFDAYVCISGAARDVALRARLPPARLHVIEPGVEARPPSAAVRQRDLLLYVGRLVRRKGLAWFVRDVLPELARDRPNLRLVVVGDGPERAAIEAAAHLAGVATRIEWRGHCDDAQKAELFGQASICVMPNVAVAGDMEGFGLVALEAAAAGCPVIASNLEGLRDALAGGRTGTLLPPQDAPAWIREIRGQLDDPDRSLRRAAAICDDIVRNRTWDAMAASYEQLFQGLVEARAEAASA